MYGEIQTERVFIYKQMKSIPVEKKRAKRWLNFTMLGLLLGICYWVATAFRDARILGKTDVATQLFMPDEFSLWTRLTVVLALVFMGMVIQSLRD